MSHEYILWIATIAYGLHAMEEYELNWRDWARHVLNLPVDWISFSIANGLVVVLGVCCAAVGWRRPEFSLVFPALMVINATFFHVLPFVVTRVFSPGLFTAILLFYPLAAWLYHGAWADGALTTETGVVSSVLGALIMAYPIILLRIKGRPYFKQ